MAAEEKEKKDFVRTVEGRTTFLVPQSSLTERVPPKTPAFFNPAARLNRDLSVLAYRAFAPSLTRKTFADSFTGIGARALRVAVEVPEIEKVYGNDINPVAIEAARKAAKINSVDSKCHFSIDEVCKFLLHGDSEGERFGIVDLDPFGTPAKHIDCVLRAVLDGGLVSITATDTAVLCGVYPEVCLRRYYGRPLNNSYGNETAIRLLLSLIALTASRLELSIRPLFVHAAMHYLRIYASVSVSSSEANDVYASIGYVMHCLQCGHRFKTEEYNNAKKCELCGSVMRTGGQLWTGPFHDREFVKKMMLEQSPDRQSKKVLDAAAEEESGIPYYFRADEISAKLRTNPHSVQNIIERLQSAGFVASKTVLNPSAFKTDARIDQILEALK
ncbi:MAG: tRNA (guanine(10)-N(2))-dimethyltransferase [Nitrososphaera sp.]|uniref:tRNA (guanine(26)-N(2))-dimethyltransferase n=1 Tax=Nitrososphaera gargensis (strain Ga9.2) TaxID=1237085 RepID=K0IJU5_NITGG|nr:tRNA (guanine(10)-N(2))-dimethyltransferase [Candidatus Nitrososphaera gargensis]AFU60370.1 N(2),N(2)-dimethylguanosine tRNA methyltransferase [Candidatus Nitrososphaera gargensis Ga9.2]